MSKAANFLSLFLGAWSDALKHFLNWSPQSTNLSCLFPFLLCSKSANSATYFKLWTTLCIGSTSHDPSSSRNTDRNDCSPAIDFSYASTNFSCCMADTQDKWYAKNSSHGFVSELQAPAGFQFLFCLNAAWTLLWAAGESKDISLLKREPVCWLSMHQRIVSWTTSWPDASSNDSSLDGHFAHQH